MKIWFNSLLLASVVGCPHILNIATGETSQAITPYHFLNYFNFFGFYHYITSFFYLYKIFHIIGIMGSCSASEKVLN